MIYSNKTLYPFSCTVESFKLDATYEIFKVAMGTDRENCLELICSPKGKISEGLNRMTTIGRTKKGILRTTHGYDHDIYMLLATRTKKRDIDAFKVLNADKSYFHVLKKSSGIDSTNYLWSFILCYAPEFSLMRVKEINSVDKLYVILKDNVEKYTIEDLEEVCSKYDFEVPKEEDWVSL